MGIDLDNKTTKSSASVFLTCCAAGVPCILESPSSSMLWEAPPISNAARRKAVSQVRVDFCQIGTKWEKQTLLMCVGVDTCLLEKRCSGKGLCSSSGAPHVELRGKTSTGHFLTRVAETYSDPFANAMADTFWNGCLAIKASGLQRVI